MDNEIFRNYKPRLSDEEIIEIDGKPRFYRRNDIVLFNSYKKNDTGIMSNFYSNCGIKYDGREFHSSEQLMFYRNIMKWGEGFVGKDDIINLIMDCKCGRDVKNNYKIKKFRKKVEEKKREVLGLKGAYLESWKNLYFCIKKKYEYCKEFRDVLEKYKNKIYVEDSFWGDNFAGCMYENGWYKGINACGRVMRAVYNEGIEGKGNRLEEV
jgi:predicted NAD-dependent protein-ADP-ribosyltransferase YbiA (DUF1768 family)